MSAIVCGKRSLFEDLATASPPISKKIYCISSSSPPRPRPSRRRSKTCLRLFVGRDLCYTGLEKFGDGCEGDSDVSDAIAAHVRRLAMEVRQLASARQITVMNGVSSENLQALVVPAAALRALGYGYMGWKRISFSDLMYVTKANMANAVANLTKNLKQVLETLAATKRHLMQKIPNMDDKVEPQPSTMTNPCILNQYDIHPAVYL